MKTHRGKSLHGRPARASSTQRPEPRDEIPKNWRVVIGQHAIVEALRMQSRSAELLWLRQGWESSQDLKKLHSDSKSIIRKIEVKPPSLLDRLGASHQGAALFLSYTPELDWQQLERKSHSIIMFLDGIEDPHNLGAILRTAWLSKVDGIFIPEDRAVGLTPTVHKVACGGVEHVPVEVCTNFSNPLERLKEMGYWAFGLSHLGKGSLFNQNFPEKVIWFVGAEDKGLRSTSERLCDELVHIPQVDAAASYNASVAAGIALAETRRQWQLKK